MDIRKFIESLTPEQIEEGNRKQFEENQRVYNEFKSAYEKGKCSLCGLPLNQFKESQPCFHWFLKPDGIKKKHFTDYLSRPFHFFRFDSYIRWMANLEVPFKNVNDLKEEMNPAKITEYTVRFKNIEWSVNVGKTDFEGHQNSRNAAFPHFHIQMKVDGQYFLRFNDFHIPFSEEDIFTFQALDQASDKVVWRNSFGDGMRILEDEDMLQQIDNLMKRTDDVENATFNTGTMVQMPEGETMSGEALEKIIAESKETGTPIRHLIKKYYPNATMVTEISPGDGVPEISKRNRRK